MLWYNGLYTKTIVMLYRDNENVGVCVWINVCIVVRKIIILQKMLENRILHFFQWTTLELKSVPIEISYPLIQASSWLILEHLFANTPILVSPW